jgi:4-carboxymuconolactone decarboxylase
MSVAAHEESLRRLALHDEQCIQSLLGIPLSDDKTAGLDPKARALVRLGALIALGASCVSYGWAVDAALAAGVTEDEIVGTLVAVAPLTGVAHVVAATPAVARSLGYDLDWAFEALDSDPCD